MRLGEMLHALWEGRADAPGMSHRAWEWTVLLFAMFLFGVGVVALIAFLAFADAYLPKDRAAQRTDTANQIDRSLEIEAVASHL